MTTFVNTPGNASADNSAVGLVVGLVIAAALTVLFILYGVPALRGAAMPQSQPSNSIDVHLPDVTPTPAPTPAPSTTPTP